MSRIVRTNGHIASAGEPDIKLVQTSACQQECFVRSHKYLRPCYSHERLTCGHDDIQQTLTISMILRGYHTGYWFRCYHRISLCGIMANIIGTAILAFGISFVAAMFGNAGPVGVLLIALTATFLLSALIDTFKHVAGASFNPGLTIFNVAILRVDPLSGFFHLLAQILGGSLIAGCFLLCFLYQFEDSDFGTPLVSDDFGWWRALIAESIAGAFLFICHEYSVTHSQNVAQAMGFCLGAIHLVILPISGSSVNFARYLAPVAFSGSWHHFFWIYFLSNLVISPIIAAAFVWAAKLIGWYDEDEEEEGKQH